MNARFRTFLKMAGSCLFLIVFGVGCQRFGGPEPTPTTAPLFNPAGGMRTVDCPFNIPFNSNIEATCGVLEVPEDYAVIGGRMIELFTAIVHSSSDNPRRDPIVILPPDAGLSLLDSVGYIGLQLGELLAERDLVYMEYRGLGHSGPRLECPEYLEAYFKTAPAILTPDQEAVIYEETLKTCKERLINKEIDPTKYTANEIAADLSTLRLALGYEQFNLLAGGYGAEITLILARDFPQSVRSAAIFQASIPQQYLRSEMTAISLQQSLDLLFNRCLADEDCRRAYPDLEGMFYGAVDQLNRTPGEVGLFFPGESRLTNVAVSGNDIVLLVQAMMMNNQTLAGVPKLVDEIAHGKVNTISDELQRFRMQIPDEIVEGPEISANCFGLHANFLQTTPASRDVQPVILQAVEKNYQVLRMVCPTWTGSQPGEPAGGLIRSDVPILILQGEYTPHLSPAIVGDQVREMKNALHVVIPHLSNDFFGGDSCGGLLIFEWFLNPNPGMDTGCINNTQPIKFYMPGP
jgi:pimeloyl-ACP methyl ester carboxylesterase